MKRAILTALVLGVSCVPSFAQEQPTPGEELGTRHGCSCEDVRTEQVRDLIDRYPSGGASLADTLAAALIAGEFGVEEVACGTKELTGSRVLDVADGLAEATRVWSQSMPERARAQVGRLQCSSLGLQSAYYAARAVSVYAGGVGKNPAPLDPVSRSRP